MPTTYYIGSQAGLRQLDDHLFSHTRRAARAYITGYHASKDDITVHAAFTDHPSPQYVHICQWYNHITDLLRIGGFFGKGSGVLVDTSAPLPTDLLRIGGFFGQGSGVLVPEDEEAPTMYFVVLDVSPWDDETDMQRLEEEVRSVQIEGLEWGESMLVPIGYGISKLRVEMTILVREESCIDFLIEERFSEEHVKEHVQSFDLVVCRPVNS